MESPLSVAPIKEKWPRPTTLKLRLHTSKESKNPLTTFSRYLWNELDALSPSPLAKRVKGTQDVPAIVVHGEAQDTAQAISPLLSEKNVPQTESEMGMTHAKPTATQEVSAPTNQTVAQKINIELTAEKVTCLGNTKRGLKCTNAIAKSNSKEAGLVLGRLEKSGTEELCKDGSGRLEILAELLLCKRFHQNQASSLAKAWETAILPTPNTRRASDSFVVAKRCSVTQTTVTTKPTDGVVTQTNCLVTHTCDGVSLVSTRITAQFLNVKGSQTCIRTFVPFDPLAKSLGRTENYVKGAIKKNLTPREELSGLIYIYWFPGNFGHVKIGVTTRTPEERLREWQKQCGHDPILLYPVSEGDRVPMPHVYRVEKIVHALLRNRRRKELKCRKCEKCHREWFESVEQEAIAAVKTWSAWMRENPYEQVKGVWRLKKDHNEDVGTLCQKAPDDQSLKVSTSQLSERSRRLSTSPDRRRRAKSEGPLRRSPRLATQQRSTSAARSEASETSIKRNVMREKSQ